MVSEFGKTGPVDVLHGSAMATVMLNVVEIDINVTDGGLR